MPSGKYGPPHHREEKMQQLEEISQNEGVAISVEVNNIWRDNAQMDDRKMDLRKALEIPSPFLKLTIQQTEKLAGESDEDMELPQAIEKVLDFKSEQAPMISVEPDAVAQPVAVREEKGSSNVPLIFADD
ncbi:hypothetical protein TNCT_418011 [Trichonephila clavata]|uniref:Uncharacterized protein n=1 Tax=Trichonephila clavata TaxID=2740835 RepID=A0A8X6FLV5_TRICU|nr:hypothetical protein TNCT_418011 [Trichonephila clavata]